MTEANEMVQLTLWRSDAIVLFDWSMSTGIAQDTIDTAAAAVAKDMGW